MPTLAIMFPASSIVKQVQNDDENNRFYAQGTDASTPHFGLGLSHPMAEGQETGLSHILGYQASGRFLFFGIALAIRTQRERQFEFRQTFTVTNAAGETRGVTFTAHRVNSLRNNIREDRVLAHFGRDL